MSEFWNIFKKTGYFKFSWRIQDKIGESIENSIQSAKKKEEADSLKRNSSKIIDAVYNNPFTDEINKNKED